MCIRDSPEEASALFGSVIDETRHSAVGVRAMASQARLMLDTDGYEAAVSLIEQAQEAARSLPPDVQEWTLERASLLHTFAGRTERATQTAQTQIEIACFSHGGQCCGRTIKCLIVFPEIYEDEGLAARNQRLRPSIANLVSPTPCVVQV